MSKRYQGKVAIVTGAASGIGFAVAERLADEGALVTVLDIAGAEEAAEKLGADGLTVDVSDADAVERAFSQVVQRHGGIHVIVNNAGISGPLSTPIGEYPPDAFDRVDSVNLRGVFLGMRYGIPLILQSGGGAGVNTASAAAIAAPKGIGPFNASKSGVTTLTKTAAAEYSSQGVRVNCILPGPVLTPLLERQIAQNPEIKDDKRTQLAIGRMGRPEEPASAVAFLASEDASDFTGVALPVDGGRLLS